MCLCVYLGIHACRSSLIPVVDHGSDHFAEEASLHQVEFALQAGAKERGKQRKGRGERGRASEGAAKRCGGEEMRVHKTANTRAHYQGVRAETREDTHEILEGLAKEGQGNVRVEVLDLGAAWARVVLRR